MELAVQVKEHITRTRETHTHAPANIGREGVTQNHPHAASPDHHFSLFQPVSAAAYYDITRIYKKDALQRLGQTGAAASRGGAHRATMLQVNAVSDSLYPGCVASCGGWCATDFGNDYDDVHSEVIWLFGIK